MPISSNAAPISLASISGLGGWAPRRTARDILLLLNYSTGIAIKTLSHEKKLYLDRYSRRVNSRVSHYSPWKKKETITPLAEPGGNWKAPIVFSLYGVYRPIFLKSLAQLRHKVGVLAEDVCLDFSETEKVFAEGMLLFYAEIKRLIRHTHGRVEISCSVPNNSKVAQVLKKLGLLDLLGVKAQITPVDHDVVSWRAASGHLVLGAKYDDILQHYDGEIAPYLQANLYTGITEAMTNVLNHAYDLGREDGLDVVEERKNWWMFSHERDNVLSVVFCDLGAGIPRTLPLKRKNVWNRLRRKGLKSDSEIIKFAVKDSVSRTRKSHRGKGLRQIVEVINGVVGAEAAVFSNKGTVVMRSGGKSQLQDHQDSIMGTLIFWRIPLHVKEEV